MNAPLSWFIILSGAIFFKWLGETYPLAGSQKPPFRNPGPEDYMPIPKELLERMARIEALAKANRARDMIK